MKKFLLAACLFFAAFPVYGEPKRPTVVELFTAQGCPSCPRADEILKKIAANANYLPLSFHVTYFDKEGWKDPYAKQEHNLRQRRYLAAAGVDSPFTPHMVVDGTISAVGANAKSVAEALSKAQEIALYVPLSMTLSEAGDGLNIKIGNDNTPVPVDATLYEVHFNKSVMTPVSAGGNQGLTVENVNNVIAFFPVPLSSEYFVPISRVTGDGIAYLLHNKEGRIMGAASYIKP